MSTTDLTERVIATKKVGNRGEIQTWLGTQSAPYMGFCRVPVNDAQIIADFYSSLPESERIPGVNTIELVQGIGFRVFEEWCLEQEKKDPLKSPYHWYADEKYSEKGYPGFSDFINQETHLELDIHSGRAGRLFEWDKDKRHFKHFDQNHYDNVRADVVRGLVLRAIDCCKRWGSLYSSESNEEHPLQNLNFLIINSTKKH